MKTILYAILRALVVSFFGLVALAAVLQAETESTSDSTLTGVRLPTPAVRLRAESVPGEVDDALRNLVAAAGERARQGEAEALAWTGNGYRKSHVTALMTRLTRELKTAGWTYEAAGSDGDLTIFSLVRTTPTRRALVGFFTSSDDALVLAWTEILAAQSVVAEVRATPAQVPVVPRAAQAPAANVINVDPGASFVNVMGKEMPPLPAFPAITRQPGKVRGYVKDVNGAPIEGAALGVRSTAMGGFYSGAQGETDANGYYEFAVPAGVAHFYNAGVALDWGDGMAAVTLHPADGKLGSFASTDGAVENFVLLPFGVTSRENLSENPHLPSTYYGGALYIGHWTRAANDNWAPTSNLVEGSVVEIILTPEGEMLGGGAARSFVIRRPAVGTGFRINNLPLGQYRIRAHLANGTPLKLSLNKPRNSIFGMVPAQTTDDALITFAPDGAKASMVIPAYGSWNAVEISVELP